MNFLPQRGNREAEKIYLVQLLENRKFLFAHLNIELPNYIGMKDLGLSWYTKLERTKYTSSPRLYSFRKIMFSTLPRNLFKRLVSVSQSDFLNVLFTFSNLKKMGVFFW